MLSVATPMFLLIPGESEERVLHAGKVLESPDAETFVCEFEQPVAPAVGAAVTVFCEVRGKFCQQGAEVAAVRQTEPTPVVAFRRVGEPISAEGRGTFRVCTANSGLVVRLNNHRNCPVVDISPDGMAVVLKWEYAAGTVMRAQLVHEDDELEGQVRLQCVKRLPNGTFRYGFLVIDRRGKMRRGLEKMSAEFQRGQLRRLSRSA